MYHDVYGEREKARALFQKLGPDARRLADIDWSGPSRACPHGVDIAAHMRRAQKVLV
jgi:hypothetical protein